MDGPRLVGRGGRGAAVESVDRVLRGARQQTRGRLCATGYEMNEEQSLQAEEELVFGNLVDVDPLAGLEERL